MVCLIRNVNAQVSDEKIADVIKRFGVKGANENGELMLQLCVESEAAMSNTFFFTKKYIHEGT